MVTYDKSIPLVAVNGAKTGLGQELDLYKSERYLRNMVDQGKYFTDIAEECNTTIDKVKYRAKKYGVKGNKRSYPKGHTPWNTGKTYTMSDEQLVNVRKHAKSRVKKDKYKGHEDDKVKRGVFLQEYKKEILEQYDFKCVLTGRKDSLQLHHLDPVWNNDERKFDKTNLVPVNKYAHRIIHSHNLDIELLKWHEEGNPLIQFLDQYKDIKLKCKDIGKPKSKGNHLVCKFLKIKSIKYLGARETYDIEVEGPYHNFVANGIVVHNSRNSASSRAIPFKTMLKRVRKDPFVPIKFQKDHSGMQGTEYFRGFQEKVCKFLWLRARDFAVASSWTLNKFGVTKQLANRILEPFLWHKVIITATEWENFFALRAHEAAEIHIQELAFCMLEAYNESVPRQLKNGEWHIPFGDILDPDRAARITIETLENKGVMSMSPDILDFAIEATKTKIATSRCARISYLNFEGKDDYEADLKLYERLSDKGHWSPFEHCAYASSGDFSRSGNFNGPWVQLRKTFLDENKKDKRVNK